MTLFIKVSPEELVRKLATPKECTYWFSFQLAIIAHPLSVTCSDIAPVTKINVLKASLYKTNKDFFLWVIYVNTLNIFYKIII